MEQNKIDMFVAQNATKLPLYKLELIKNALAQLDDEKSSVIQHVKFKDPKTMLIISFLCGELGIDRFLLGEVGLGVLKLLTCGAFVWWIIDMVNIQELTREYNYRKLCEALAVQGVTGLY